MPERPVGILLRRSSSVWSFTVAFADGTSPRETGPGVLEASFIFTTAVSFAVLNASKGVNADNLGDQQIEFARRLPWNNPLRSLPLP